MTPRILKHIVIIVFIVLMGQSGAAADRVAVFVSIAPQKYFVQQIGKDLVDVRIMVPPGASPSTYEPRPRQMTELAASRIYFAIGVAFENTWLDKIAAVNPGMRVVHTDNGIEKIPMDAHPHADQVGRRESHSDEDAHGHGGLDPHIWLSPPLVTIQARTILAALQEIDSEHQNTYAANYRDFISRIDKLDADLKKTFVGRQNLQFMVFHPAWGYFARAYGLRQVPIEIEGKKPKPALLKESIEHAREKGIRVVFVQPQFSRKSAEIVAREIGGRVVVADPLAEDWMANLAAVAASFKAALK